MPRTPHEIPYLSYSPDADAVAIELAPGHPGDRRTRELAPRVRADFIGELLVGFEILEASTLIPGTFLQAMQRPVDEVTLATAAQLLKRSPNTLRILLRSGRIAGARKRGRDWVVPRAALWEYLDSLAPSGRPAEHPRAPRRRRGTR